MLRSTSSLLAPLTVVALAGAALLGLDGCSRTASCGDLVDGCEGTGESGETGEGTTTGGGGGGGLPLAVNKDVDILFVIDNSGSMGEEQAILAANVGSFIDVLEADQVEANYRIGITTTDNGNPWCPPGQTTPEGGQLVSSPCTERLGDFVFNNGEVDVRDLACNDICTLDPAELEILPTTTDVDPNPVARPWLERIEGHKNIPDGTSTAAAFACFGPMGINGCGFESPLESMYLALVRAQNIDEASYGFLRQNAILAVVIVTDEADCSYNKDFATIFEADGNKVFWSDPADSFPSSAVCWNAGVECSGDPSSYASCDPVNKDEDGNPGVGDAAAVLHPMSRYIGLLDGLEAEKQEISADNQVVVSLIAGVGVDGVPHYADVDLSDSEFQHSFGIGPGCTAPNPLDPNSPVEAVPPVRLRVLTEAFTPDNMFSICEADYSAALEAVAAQIRDQINPACYSQCAADSDPATEILEPSCVVKEDQPGQDPTEVPECLRDGQGYVIDPDTQDYAMPDDQTRVCYAALVDSQGLSADPRDDMSPECTDANFNLEFKVVRRPGFPAPGGTSMSAVCEVDEFPDLTCPGIGG